MNTELLRRVQRHILAEPKRVRMNHWVSPYLDTGENGERKGFAECGTAACIGGWGVLLQHNQKEVLAKAREFRRCNADSWERQTNALFDLEDSQGARLFILGYWPPRLKARYENAASERGRARVVSDRINLFIRTEGEQ